MPRLLMLLATAALVLAQEPEQLQILVIGGEGSINNVKQRTAREPVVEVRDRNNRPVAGAIVLFEAPRNGASGTFLGGSPSLRVTTDAQGRAVGQNFRPNTSSGSFNIQVTATLGAATATTVIHMQNAAAGVANAAHAGHGKLIAVLVTVGAAAAAGGAYAATHNGGSTPATPAAVPTTITAGTGTVTGHP